MSISPPSLPAENPGASRAHVDSLVDKANFNNGRIGGKLIGYFKQLAVSLGLDPAALLEHVGIDRRHLDDTQLTLPSQKIVQLIERSADFSGVDDFGLRLAEVCGLPDLGPAGILMREELTVRDALQTMIDLSRLRAHEPWMLNYLEDGDDPVLRMDMIRQDVGSLRQILDFNLGLQAHILRWLLGDRWSPVAVCFTHSRPRAKKCFERLFRCPVHFSHEFNGIVLRRTDLDMRMPPLSSVLRSYMEVFLQAIDIVPGDVFVHRVTRVIALALPHGQASAERTAQSLGVDRRTLNRRLTKSHLNYSALVEQIRRNLAMQHLLGSDRALLDIASLLGFGSLSAFTRWFHRAFDSAPRAWRKERRAAASVDMQPISSVESIGTGNAQ